MRSSRLRHRLQEPTQNIAWIELTIITGGFWRSHIINCGPEDSWNPLGPSLFRFENDLQDHPKIMLSTLKNSRYAGFLDRPRTR